MPETSEHAGNRLLAALSPADFRLLQPVLSAVDLPLRKQLEVQGKPIKYVYFLTAGLASVVANGGRPMEVGLIGNEGMTGLPILLGKKAPAAHQTYMQVAGRGWRMEAPALTKAIKVSSSLHYAMLSFVDSYMAQTASTVLSNGRGKLEQRLARWLCMVHDRLERNELPLTHEFVAVMLGVQRPGVTLALQDLERRGVIAQRRSIITVIDRDGLESLAADYAKLVRN